MKTTKVINNETKEEMKTKEGKTLEEHRFEIGDEFIPEINGIIEKTNEWETPTGENKKITNYKIVCKVMDKNGKQYKQEDGTETYFVTLTPSQAKTLKKKIEEGLELNQELFVVYEYESKNYGKQIGVGLKKTPKPAKSFKDFKE